MGMWCWTYDVVHGGGAVEIYAGVVGPLCMIVLGAIEAVICAIVDLPNRSVLAILEDHVVMS